MIALWRYPVKSFLGERLEEASLGERGIDGDRGYAIRDIETGHVLSAKKFSMLLRARAQTNEDSVLLTLPDGTSIEVGSAGAGPELSAWIGRGRCLRRPP